MVQKLLDYFATISPLTPEESDAISATIKIQHYKKGTVLLAPGQISMATYFVLEGCVRQYHIVDGFEKVQNFFTESQWVISMQSFANQTPSNHFMECSEDCTLVVGNREREEGLYDQFPRLQAISRKVMEKVFAEQQENMASYLTDSPEQRYSKLILGRPELLQRIPQYQLASYIGVRPESLSRIRKRIATKS